MKQWKCTVCGYIHKGAGPPDKCPVCGADSSKFIEVTEEDTPPGTDKAEPEADIATQQGEDNAASSFREQLPFENILSLTVKHHAHPISVHIPNGVVPVSVLFLGLSVLGGFFDAATLSKAALFNMIVVLLSMPLVLITGWAEWQLKYNGATTSYFIIKLVCGGVVTILSFVIVLWFLIDPDVAMSAKRWWFLLLNLILLGVVALAGHIGGKLIFKD
jgi:rubredoxin/uncharacterized membrane protein